MYQTTPAADYRVMRLRQERRRKERRRKLMQRRAVALLLLLAMATAVFFIVRAAGRAVYAVFNSEEPQSHYSETLYTLHNGTPVRAEAPATEPLTASEPIATAEQAADSEPTIEEMLASGYLTDDIALTYDLQLVARDAAETFNVPYKLLLAVMFRESSYNPKAENGICFGLMQIHKMNSEWLEGELKDYGVTDIKNNPEDNIKAGAYLLGGFIEKYGDYHKALMCYNCGEGRAKELWNEGYTTTRYTRNVHETMSELNVADDITER